MNKKMRERRKASKDESKTGNSEKA